MSASLPICHARSRSALARALRLFGCFALLAFLAACGGNQSQEAANYARHARGNYTPPGPPNDPWGPYIKEASAKYDMPQSWVRAVMMQESSGQLYEHGQLITSGPGAMGLMQVMPRTYDELRVRYALGDDPYDPHDNIMAGTAYLREMYDVYGNPAFLAAYNAGPGRVEDYFLRNRTLPAETRNYVAKIGPQLTYEVPRRPAGGTQFAQYDMPVQMSGGGVRLASAESRSRATTAQRGTSSVLARKDTTPQRGGVQLASANVPQQGGFNLISTANASPQSGRNATGGGNNWGVQVSKSGSGSALGQAKPATSGMSREAAIKACDKIKASHGSCVVVAPNARG